MSTITVADIDATLAEVRSSLIAGLEFNCGKAFTNHEEAIGAITLAYYRVVNDACSPMTATTESLGCLASICTLVLAQSLAQLRES